jgi:serine phosphatase RsbU (regulator of sigma subunit)
MPEELLARPELSDNPPLGFLRHRYGLLLRDIVARGKPQNEAERQDYERIVADMDAIQAQITEMEGGN